MGNYVMKCKSKMIQLNFFFEYDPWHGNLGNQIKMSIDWDHNKNFCQICERDKSNSRMVHKL